MELNKNQTLAVNHKDGPCLVLAGPGSGKTAVLTARINTLIQSGVPASEILVITFTKAAAIEMKERFERLSDDIYPVTFGTFHSLFWGILQRETGLKNSDIILGSSRLRLIKEAMKRANLASDDYILVKAFSSELSNMNNHIDEEVAYIPKYVEKHDLDAFSREYELLKEKYHVIDFDDMLIKTYRLFISNSAILKKWQERFSYFLVDEMQDMNDIQYRLIKMLSSRTNNLFCVGDDDQSIYGFRGSNPKIMKNFADDYANIEKIVLDQNYRNPANIVEAASHLISKNSNRFDKAIKANVLNGGISIWEFETESDEAEAVVNQIEKLKSNDVNLDDIAVLYRNHSDAKYLVDYFLKAKIPFYLKEQMPNIYTHFIINDIETYFQLAIGNVTKARLLSIINRPNRYIHRRCLEVTKNINEMMEFYNDNPSLQRRVEAFALDLRLISKMSATAAINYINNAMGYGSFLKEDALKSDSDLNEHKEVISFLIESTKDCRTIKQAIDRINFLRLKVDYENKNKKVSKDDKVGMYTLHSSKGLEFENVFIIGLNDGVIPSNKAETKDEIEAERRLFYVGITRTKENLYLSYTNKKNRDKSRFLDEMKIDYSSSNSSEKISSNLAETASYSSSDSMLSSEGEPSSSSK